MDFNDLTPEQKAKALAAKTTEELLALAKEEGVELTDADLEAASGGWENPDGIDPYEARFPDISCIARR